MNGRHQKTLAALAILATCGVIAVAAVKAVKASKSGRRGEDVHWDPVDLYIEESFPASDAPSYSPTVHIGGIT